MTNHYHEGELAAQEKAGVRVIANKVGSNIGSDIPDAAKAFLAQARLIAIATVDAAGQPWASIASGPTGFLWAEDRQTVRIAWGEYVDHQTIANLSPGASIGLLVPDLSTRRRARLNGRVKSSNRREIVFVTDQVYANCPKYIQQREFDCDVTPLHRGDRLVAPELTEKQRLWVREADTFFIATAHPRAGADASHRGGLPGFVAVDRTRISWPDYKGNAMFNTIGNVIANPRASLAFIDFETGSTLQVSGKVAVDWGNEVAKSNGTARRIVLDVEHVVEVAGAVPIRMRLIEYSPVNPAS